MVKQYIAGMPSLIIKSDLAGEFPLYLYWSQDKQTLLYSKSITDLLDNQRVSKPLSISNEGLSFLLQSGVVPPPMTAFQHIFILGIGDAAEIKTNNGKIEVDFNHEFLFVNTNRPAKEETNPDEGLILQMLAEATISRIDESKPSFLFHSAGKDSNSIALALAEAGWQDKVTLVTHKSKGAADESEISAKIAKQLGFKHQVLHEVDNLEKGHKLIVEDYFVRSPFPCTDNVSLAYPLYAYQLPELKGANIIDGMGNDVYIGHIPGRSEFKRQNISRYLKYSRILTQYTSSESMFHIAGRARCEWTGLSGFSYSDAKCILPELRNVAKYWFTSDNSSDYLDFRASIRGTIIDQEVFTRKVRNFSDSYNSNLILPFTRQEIAEYFLKIPEAYLFDRNKLKNKLILRKMLKERINLDSAKLGKLVFSYDSSAIVLLNWAYITQEIYACKLWNQTGLIKILNRLKKSMQSKHRYADFSGRLIYRMYLLSSWVNRSKYLN